MAWRADLDYLLEEYSGHGGLKRLADKLKRSRMTLWAWRAGVEEPSYESRMKLRALAASVYKRCMKLRALAALHRSKP